MRNRRSPGFRLFLAALVGTALIVPLLMVYGLVSDRQHQARVAESSIVQGAGGAQVVSGPVLVIPYTVERTSTEMVDDRAVTRVVTAREELFLSPSAQSIESELAPERKHKGIYETVVYEAAMRGNARFAFPDDLQRFGVTREQLLFDEAQLRFGASDMRGLRNPASVNVDGEPVDLKPGEGVAASGGAGFHGFVEWDGEQAMLVEWRYVLNGSRTLAFVPRGGRTDWRVTSPWPHPGFGGSFLPDESEVSADGFTASWSVGNLALGQAMVMQADPGPPVVEGVDTSPRLTERPASPDAAGSSKAATIQLVAPADVYAQVDRAVKYGFLFIGFTFLAYLMFDILGGARVATAEYLLTGAGLVLFFVLLLAFAEVVPFALAYTIASAAIMGLLTAYSAAVLGSWKRARVIGGLLVALYALLYVLLGLEAFALLIGAILLFVALAAVMYATRRIDWSAVGQRDEEDEEEFA